MTPNNDDTTTTSATAILSPAPTHQENPLFATAPHGHVYNKGIQEARVESRLRHRRILQTKTTGNKSALPVVPGLSVSATQAIQLRRNVRKGQREDSRRSTVEGFRRRFVFAVRKNCDGSLPSFRSLSHAVDIALLGPVVASSSEEEEEEEEEVPTPTPIVLLGGNGKRDRSTQSIPIDSKKELN